MTTGEQLYDRLAEIRKAGPLTRERWIEAVDACLHEIAIAKKKAPKRAPADRPRNPLYDCLATQTGIRDMTQVTRTLAKQIGVALADIREVCPALTVADIERTVAMYRQRHPTWPCTALSIAKHWGEFAKGTTSVTSSGRRDVYQEPVGWQASEAARAAIKCSPETWQMVVERGWFELSVDIRADILKALF